MRATASNKTKHPLDIQTFNIKPTELHTVKLGRFRFSDPEPKFQIIYHEQDVENPNVVSYHDVAVQLNSSTYKVYRHFQSYSQQVHRLTVRFARQEDRALDQS
ncbi:hypothetical protein [Amycolatopsis sp. NPDC059657]|uniref:hypothetical protein n=1 Tax=Amycolatopsis sp. NPDC059657 TaxID=3346899 RepID=UPI00366CFB5D